MKIIKNTILMGLCAAVCLGTLSAYDQTFREHALKSYLNCYPTLEKPQEANLAEVNLTSPNDLIKWLFKGKPLLNPSISQRDRLEIVYNTLKTPENNEQLIDQNFINKLAFTYDEKIDSTQPIVHSLIEKTGLSDLSLTTFGEHRFFELLMQPTNNVKLLEQRQHFLQQLLADKKLFKKAQGLLKTIKENEHFLLEFYRNKDLVKDKVYKEVYFGDSFRRLNQSSTALGFSTRWSQAMAVLGIGWLPGLCLGLAYKYSDYIPAVIQLIPQFIKECETAGISKAKLIGFSSFYAGLIGFSWIYPSIVIVAQQKLRATIANFLQTQMIGVAQVIRSMQELHDLLDKNPQLKKCFPALKDLDLNAIEHEKTSELVDFLNSDTFTGEASVFSSVGRVLAAYKMIDDASVKESLHASLRALGELDAFVGLANTISLVADKPNHFSFATFVENQTPYINAINMWNPFISPDIAIGNDMQLGRDQRPNLIITGPNKGGKSTFMKTIALNLWLSQTFGIVAADQFEMTPFAYLGCHLNEQEAIGNLSHFQAQAYRAKELLTRLRSIPAGQYSFVLLDEMFSGTSPDQEINESKKFLRLLSDMHNCIFVDATHHHQLTALEEETTSCRNVHMEALTDNQGTVIKYTYKLVPGVSKVKNADQVIKDEGIDWAS